MNIGNPHEISIRELADAIQEVVGATPGIDFQPRPTDDPNVRNPDISKARSVLGWEPEVDLQEGLRRTFEWFSQRLQRLTWEARRPRLRPQRCHEDSQGEPRRPPEVCEP